MDITEKLDIDWFIYGVCCAGRYNTYTVKNDTSETLQVKLSEGVEISETDTETV